jgi:hypothetical protein
LENYSKNITGRVDRRGELIDQHRNYSRERIVRSNTKKLRRLQIIDKRRARALMRMAKQMRENIMKKIQIAVREYVRGLVDV